MKRIKQINSEVAELQHKINKLLVEKDAILNAHTNKIILSAREMNILCFVATECMLQKITKNSIVSDNIKFLLIAEFNVTDNEIVGLFDKLEGFMYEDVSLYDNEYIVKLTSPNQIITHLHNKNLMWQNDVSINV